MLHQAIMTWCASKKYPRTYANQRQGGCRCVSRDRWLIRLFIRHYPNMHLSVCRRSSPTSTMHETG